MATTEQHEKCPYPHELDRCGKCGWSRPPKPKDKKWLCGKCDRELALGYDDGQIPEHHHTCSLKRVPNVVPQDVFPVGHPDLDADAYEPKRPHQWDRVGICVNCGNGVKARDILDGTNLECSGVLVQLRLEGMILNTLMAIPVGNGQSQRIAMSKKIAQNLMVGGVTFV